MNYKINEIREHFNDFIEDRGEEWVSENLEDLHHYAFNEDYYIIGRYQATQWLGVEVFNVIDHIKEYEQTNFGEVATDLSEPERVVNMYAYIIGETVVADWRDERASKAELDAVVKRCLEEIDASEKDYDSEEGVERFIALHRAYWAKRAKEENNYGKHN